MTDVLKVERRQQLGTSATRKLRREGKVPAVLYGHGEANEHLAISVVDVKAILRHHAKTVKLSGDVEQAALVSDMQWDPLGIDVLHLDLIRVRMGEKVEVTVPVRLHGEAPGVRAGGVLLENQHDVQIRSSAASIPEDLELDVNSLEMGGQLLASDLALPAGVELLTPGETVLVHIEEPRQSEEPEAEAAGPSEPEVISGESSEEEGG